MSYKGQFVAGDTVDFKFTTRRPSTGVPYTLAGTPAVRVYKSNSTTQSTAGVSLTVDFDAVTGLNHVRITTASDGTFYANGSQFDVVIEAGTVDGVSVVGECVGRFGLGQVSANVTQFGGTAGAFSGGRPEVNTTHAAGVAWNSGAIQANTLAADTITSASIATGAISSDELDATAITVITQGIWNALHNDYLLVGSFGELLSQIFSNTGTLSQFTFSSGSVRAYLADGILHGGSTARLRLGSSNSLTPAFRIDATGANNPAVQLTSQANALQLTSSGAGSAALATIVSGGATHLMSGATAENADALLGRNLAGGSDGGRTVKDSLRAGRNRIEFDQPAAGQFTVYAEDDTTPAWTGTYTRGANTLGPLTATDPA